MPLTPPFLPLYTATTDPTTDGNAPTVALRFPAGEGDEFPRDCVAQVRVRALAAGPGGEVAAYNQEALFVRPAGGELAKAARPFETYSGEDQAFGGLALEVEGGRVVARIKGTPKGRARWRLHAEFFLSKASPEGA